MKRSRERATMMRNYFLQAGIQKDRIDTYSVGDDGKRTAAGGLSFYRNRADIYLKKGLKE